MINLLGQSLGRYHILEQLGEGGMATVYKAYDTRLETDVAVKVIRTENISPSVLERSLKRFEREAKSLARLTHPNIVKVTDYGEYQGKPYLVMPYLRGGTLKQKLGKPIPWQEAVQLLLPIAHALEYAHNQNLIHRDVKPANILLTESGQPMLSDFGVAKLFDMEETSDLTGTGMGVGTPEYMAPEQWTGHVTPQTDIYALGVVFYEMVTGRKPYIADTPAALLLKQANDPLPRPGSFVANLPDMVEKALLKALAKKLEDRYQDMEAFTNALEGLLAGKQVSGAYPAKQPIQESVTIDPQPQTRVDAVPAPHTQKSNLTWIAAGIGGVIFLVVCGIGLFAVFRLVASGPTTDRGPYVATQNDSIEPTLPILLPASTDAPLPTSAPEATVTYVPSSGDVLHQDQASMIYIQAGEFRMGSNEHNPDEKPSHIVEIASYWIDKTEVTNAMYTECVQAGTCNPPSNTRYYNASNFANHPVVNVSWNDAKTYCEWRGARLPTEAEWEKAASWDDKKKEKRDYPWGSTIDCSLANYSESCVGRTTKVGNYPSGASFYGLLDMTGNVWEWVSDWYDAYPNNPVSRPEYGTQYRVARGGSWYDNSNYARSSCRGWVIPEYFDDRTGFRCAMSTIP